VEDFQNISGKGIVATINRINYLAGNAKLMKQYDITIDNELKEKAENTTGTAIYFASGGDAKAIFVLKDKMKENAAEVVSSLQKQDIEVVMLTGDAENAAKEVAKDTPKLATKRAIVGINSPSRKVLLQAYNLILGKDAIKPFDDLEKAKDFLVS